MDRSPENRTPLAFPQAGSAPGMAARTEVSLRLGAAAILLLVVAVAVSAFWAIRNLNRAYDWVNHSQKVLDEIDALPSYTKDAIAGVRGYLLTGNKLYLRTYSNAIENIPPHLDSLLELTNDNPDQHRRAEEFRPILEQELEIQKQILGLHDAGESSSQLVPLIDHGKLTMDSLRNLDAEMKKAETKLLNDRLAAAGRRASEVQIWILLMSGLALLFLAVSYAIAQRDRRRREESTRVVRASEEKLRLTLNSMAEGMYSIDLDGNCTACNPACLRLLGYQDESQLLGRNMHDLIHHSRADRSPLPVADCRIYQAFREGQRVHADDEVLWRADGTSFPAEYWSYPLQVEGLTVGAVVTFLNIAQRKQAEGALLEANQQLEKSVRDLAQGRNEIARLNQMGGALQSCLNLEEAYEVIRRSVQGLFPEEAGAVFTIVPSRDSVEAEVTWGKDFAGEKTFERDDCWALRGGHPHLYEPGQAALSCRHLGRTDRIASLCLPMMAQGEALGILHLQSAASGLPKGRHFQEARVVLAAAVAEHIALAFANLKLRDALRGQSIRDPLTRLFNRRFMEESLEKELKRAARVPQSIGLVLFDVDHFKHYNDAYGHEAGDAVLRELANFVQTLLRGEDIACRYGGEEFLLLMPGATLEVAAQRAEKIRQGVQHIQINSYGRPLGALTVSLGVAAYPAHGTQSGVLLRSADTALYAAKEQGRDRVAVAKAQPEEVS